VLFFVGAPLGAIIRKGGLGMPTVIALGLFIFYQMLTIAGEKMAKSAIVEPYVGMWISTVILLPLSIWITYKATKESTLVDKDKFSRFFKKMFGWIKFKKRRNENTTTVS
jgi:lipopolysaccharide export system permease protein